MTTMMILPASAVEDLVVSTGGDGNGDDSAVTLDGKVTMITWSTLLPQMLRIILLLVPVSSNPVVYGGINEDGDGEGPVDDEGHDGHLVIGGPVVVTGGCGDGDQALLQGSLQESLAKCTTTIEEFN